MATALQLLTKTLHCHVNVWVAEDEYHLSSASLLLYSLLLIDASWPALISWPQAADDY